MLPLLFKAYAYQGHAGGGAPDNRAHCSELVPAQEPSGSGTASASERRCAGGNWLMNDKVLGESYVLVRTNCPTSHGLQCLHVSSAY